MNRKLAGGGGVPNDLQAPLGMCPYVSLMQGLGWEVENEFETSIGDYEEVRSPVRYALFALRNKVTKRTSIHPYLSGIGGSC